MTVFEPIYCFFNVDRATMGCESSGKDIGVVWLARLDWSLQTDPLSPSIKIKGFMTETPSWAFEILSWGFENSEILSWGLSWAFDMNFPKSQKYPLFFEKMKSAAIFFFAYFWLFFENFQKNRKIDFFWIFLQKVKNREVWVKTVVSVHFYHIFTYFQLSLRSFCSTHPMNLNQRAL